MKRNTRGAFAAALAAMALGSPPLLAETFSWRTIVNNGVTVPGDTAIFNSYNQPAVSASGQVVFRARGRSPTGTSSSSGGEAGTVTQGLFLRDMALLTPVAKVSVRGDAVPPPNNLAGTFNEYPSSPRMDAISGSYVTRGQHTPVYRYLSADGVTETRVGTSGVYANIGSGLMTGASQLGAVMETQPDTSYSLSFSWYSVPDALPGTRFDQFPGSPTVAGNIVAFKGNYTDPVDTLGKTGAYFRDLVAAGGTSPVQVIAGVHTVIPNQPVGGSVTFGATAAPSAANGYAVFTGWDVEEAPTLGGIYRAPLVPSPTLQKLVGIGDPVPGETGETFTNFGEGLSISEDGRFVSFWGTWGTATNPKVLQCPVDGNADTIAYCNTTYPAGFIVQIPVHQGIFVVDAQTGNIFTVAKTTQEGITDFLYWVFSGAPPTSGTADPDREPARWRASAFSALAGKAIHRYGPGHTSPWQVAFKAARNGVDGIYLRKGDIGVALATVVETFNTTGQSVDPAAPANSIVTAVGIERDGFRDQNLAIAVSMLYETVDTSLGWAGLYMARVGAGGPKVDFNGDGKGDLAWSNNAHGDQGVWLMDGTVRLEYASVSAGSHYTIRHANDFNGDGKTDLLYRSPDGSYKVLLMNGTSVVSQATILSGGTGWEEAGRGDFNGDGKTDLLWKSGAGLYGMWLMNGTTWSQAGLFHSPGLGWDVAVIADFNGDGKDDILWRDAAGRAQIWLMNGLLSTAQAAVLASPNSWIPLMAGDFNGDGKADLLWANSDGSIGAWLMNGTAITASNVLLAGHTGWTVKMVGDLNGDGNADVILQHANGTAGAWLMNGLTISSAGYIGSAGYSPMATDDFDGDGKADIVWRDTSGAYQMTLMNGLSVSTSAPLLDGGTGWEVKPNEN